MSHKPPGHTADPSLPSTVPRTHVSIPISTAALGTAAPYSPAAPQADYCTAPPAGVKAGSGSQSPEATTEFLASHKQPLGHQLDSLGLNTACFYLMSILHL